MSLKGVLPGLHFAGKKKELVGASYRKTAVKRFEDGDEPSGELLSDELACLTTVARRGRSAKADSKLANPAGRWPRVEFKASIRRQIDVEGGGALHGTFFGITETRSLRSTGLHYCNIKSTPQFNNTL